MLVITRYIDGKIRIGDDITITCMDFDMDRKQFRIGIAAPRDVEVHREEIYQKIQRDRKASQRELPLESEEEKEARLKQEFDEETQHYLP